MIARRVACAGLTLALLSSTCPPANALQSNTAANTAEFLQQGAGARALGMGEAFGPVAEGAEAIYWNPAGLAQLKHPELSYTRSEFLQFFHHDFLAYAQPVEFLKGALGASLTRMSQDSLPVVTNANANIGEFAPHSEAISFAYARAFDMEETDRTYRDYLGQVYSIPGAYRPLKSAAEPWTGTLMTGLAVKVISESLYDRSATAVALDGGAIFRPKDFESWSMSFAFRNLGSKERFINDAESLPAELDFGLAYDKRWWQSRLLPAVEVALPYYGNPYAKLGIEYVKPVAQETTVAIRAGFKTLTATDLSPLSGLTFGLGARYKKLTVDFGFQPIAELGQVYRFTLGLRW